MKLQGPEKNEKFTTEKKLVLLFSTEVLPGRDISNLKIKSGKCKYALRHTVQTLHAEDTEEKPQLLTSKSWKGS